MTAEYRINHRTEVRADGTDGKRWRIMPLPYNVVDTYRTRFRPQVFNQYLDSEPPVFLYGHNYQDVGQVLGRMVDYDDRPTQLEYLMELSDFDAVKNARQVSAQLADGTLRRFSVGFEREADEPAEGMDGVVDITRGRNHEVSIVLDPAVPGTKVLGRRSRRDQSMVTIELVERIAKQLDRGLIDLDTAKGLIAQGAPVVGEIPILGEQGPEEETGGQGDSGNGDTSKETGPSEPTPAPDPGKGDTASPEGPGWTAELDAEITEALALAGGRGRYAR